MRLKTRVDIIFPMIAMEWILCLGHIVLLTWTFSLLPRYNGVMGITSTSNGRATCVLLAVKEDPIL